MITRKSLVLCVCASLLFSSSGLFGEETPAGYPVKYLVTEDVVYGHKDGLALTLDVLEPEQSRKGVGLLLISSGSWASSKSEIQADEDARRTTDHWCQGLLRGGFTLFVVRHGSSPRYFVPEMIPDIRRAVRFVRANAHEYRVDPRHLGITSGSSGGHLSLMAAATGDDGVMESGDPIERQSSRVQAVVAWFPPTDLVNWGKPNGYTTIELSRPGFFQRIFGKVDDLEGQLKAISPVNLVTSEMPPVLLIHGDADRTVPLQQSEVMKARCEELGVSVRLIIHQGGGHSSWTGIMDQYPAVWEWFDGHLNSQPE